MDIVKSLNLNKSPHNVPNGSMVFAKNIKITEDGTAITNDDGFIKAIPDNRLKGEIVGFIPCVEEIVVFTYDKDDKSSHIYRLKEINNTSDITVEDVKCAWKWSEGRIKGTYTYNVNKELIISIAESPKDSTSNVTIPLKTINLNTCSEHDLEATYEVAPLIPIANMKLISKEFGNNMPNGLYYFFIRYEISDNFYTKWFPIGIPQYALSLKNKTLIDHRYSKGNSDNENEALHTQVSGIYNSVYADCPYNFKFRIKLNKTYNYKNYQVGYILQHEGKTVARKWRTFECTEDNEFVFDAKNHKEADVNDLLDNVFNLYNVENIENYENRLYIANFKETNYNENLQVFADRVKARLGFIKEDNIGTVNETLNTVIYTFKGESEYKLELKKGIDFIHIIEYPELLAYLKQHFGKYFDENSVSGKNNHTLKISDAYLLLTNTTIKFYDKNRTDYTEYAQNAIVLDYKGVLGGPGGSAKVYNCRMRKDRIKISSEANVKYSTSIYIDEVKRSLMPNSVYKFYIHYVREDGTFTNGLPIKNDNDTSVPDAVKITGKTRVSIGVSSEYQIGNLGGCNINIDGFTPNAADDLTKCKEFKDKHIYELYPNSYYNVAGIGKFGYYKNYNNDVLFATGNSISISDNKLIRNTICFNNITVPDGYVGFFISYEKPENLIVTTVKCIDSDNSLFKASDVEIGLNNYIGAVYHTIAKADDAGNYSTADANEPYFAYIKASSISISNIQTKLDTTTINTTGREGCIHLDLVHMNGTVFKPALNSVAQIRMFNRNVYCGTNKILIPFGPVVATEKGNVYSYGEFPTYPNKIKGDDWEIEEEDLNHVGLDNPDINPVVNEDYNLPAFLTVDKYLKYTRAIYIDDNTGKVYDIDGNNNIAKEPTTKEDYYAKLYTFRKFSNFNLDAISIKKEPEILVGVIGESTSKNHTKTINTVVKPINATNLIEYKIDFKEQVHKQYTNFNANRRDTSVRKSIIRRSNVIQDESVENSWRFFGANAYKVINKNKGNITNLLGIGNMFYIHTEHSLLAMDKNAILKTDNQEIQLATPDLFDVEPKELFTAQHGFGGLQLPDAWCVNHNGYWFFDSANKRIYNFDDNKFNDITLDIINWIDNKTIKDIRFITDFKHDRVLICIRFSSDDIKDDYATFSYNMTSKRYISTHDYYFTESINTKNNAYFFDKVVKNNIYKYSRTNIGDYQYLANNTFGFPDNHEVVTVQNKNGKTKPVAIQSSVFDIIFNAEYGIPRMLESVRYVLNKNIKYEDVSLSRMTEPFTNDGTYDETNRYSGDILRIYTDQTDSGNLDISQPDVINVLNNYKVPHFERGVWQLNYFRNYIDAIDVDKELMAKYNIKSLDDLTEQQRKRYDEIKANYSLSDHKSLIYGKYIVLRFIFRNIDDRLPFVINDVDINIKPY